MEAKLGCKVFPAARTEGYVSYSNLCWRRALDVRRCEVLAEMNQKAFTG